jgi:hypothetical protein
MILKRAIWYPLEELELAQHMSMALLTDCLRFFAVAVGAHVPRRGLSVSLCAKHQSSAKLLSLLQSVLVKG